MTPSYKITDASTYQTQVRMINDTANLALGRGMKSTVVEEMRKKELNRLDADTARAAMDANPEVWLETIRGGTNEWQQKMDI